MSQKALPKSDVDRFRALRDGNDVRLDGSFLDRQQFEISTSYATTDNGLTVGAV